MDAQLKTKDSLQITARIKQLLYISAKLLNRSIFMIFLKKKWNVFEKSPSMWSVRSRIKSGVAGNDREKDQDPTCKCSPTQTKPRLQTEKQAIKKGYLLDNP
jgi:hypothetical protein